MSKKKFVFDSILNILATSIPLITLQIVILPVIGSILGENQYGLVVTLISLYTLLSVPFGNVLNNMRLLLDADYKKRHLSGDFNILLISGLIISTPLVVLGTICYEGSFSLVNIISMIFISCFSLVREYLIVGFRLKLNYKRILINNILLGIGYLIGTGMFFLTGYWQVIFIMGLGLSLVYVVTKTNLIKESFSRTKLFKRTTYKSIVLYISALLKTSLSYADKLLLFPLLGPSTVSIYYTATILGKIISIAITPVNNVILSYLSKKDRIAKSYFLYVIIITLTIGIMGYITTIVLSEPFLTFLYPTWASESLELIYITTASAIIGVMSMVIQPFILKFNNINWQIFISGSNVVVYMISVFTLYKFYGLVGFCIGVFVANMIKFIIMLLIFHNNRTIYR